MTWRLALAAAFLALAVHEFFRVGAAAAAVIRHPTDLVDALLSGDRSVGPWLLGAYGVLMLARAWAHRPVRGRGRSIDPPGRSEPAAPPGSRPGGGPPRGARPPGRGPSGPSATPTPRPPGSRPAGDPGSRPSGRRER